MTPEELMNELMILTDKLDRVARACLRLEQKVRDDGIKATPKEEKALEGAE